MTALHVTPYIACPTASVIKSIAIPAETDLAARLAAALDRIDRALADRASGTAAQSAEIARLRRIELAATAALAELDAIVGQDA